MIEGYSSDPALLNGSVLIVNLPDGSVSDPWPGLETVGVATWCDEESLAYGRMHGTGTAWGRIRLDGGREEAGPARSTSAATYASRRWQSRMAAPWS